MNVSVFHDREVTEASAKLESLHEMCESVRGPRVMRRLSLCFGDFFF